MQTTRPTLRSLICIGLLCALVCGGCASKYGEQTTKVNHYPQCYQPISDLRKDENIVGTSTATGAAIGAVGGALIGLLATGKAEGALAGAAVGAGTGALAGFAYGKSQKASRDAEYYARYMRDLDNHTAAMDRASAAAEVACKCYDQEFKYAVAEVKAGRMDKLEFTRRYQEIRSGLEETSRILTSANAKLAEKDQAFQQAMLEEEEIARSRRDMNTYRALKAKSKKYSDSRRRMAQAEANTQRTIAAIETNSQMYRALDG